MYILGHNARSICQECVNAFRLNKTLFLQIKIRRSYMYRVSSPAAVRSKAWVCGRSVPEIAGSKPAGPWMVHSAVFITTHRPVS
jgi:hypothetical protein